MTMFTKKFLCAYSALYKKIICRLYTHDPRKINRLEIGCRGAEKKVFDFIVTFFLGHTVHKHTHIHTSTLT